jgi:DNA-binding NarL/FixJ family response regulator
VLKSIKAEESLKSIPVVVMTTSETTQDIDESFNLSVAGYVVKPLNFDQVIKAFGTINKYWSLSEMPSDR